MTLFNTRWIATMLLLAGVGNAFAQSYPGKPITVIVPYAVGGTTDIAGIKVG